MQKLVLKGIIFLGITLALFTSLIFAFRNTIVNSILINQLEHIGVMNAVIKTNTYLVDFAICFELEKFVWKGNKLDKFKVKLKNIKKEDGIYEINLENASLNKIDLNLKSLEQIKSPKTEIKENQEKKLKFKINLNKLKVFNFLVPERKLDLQKLYFNSVSNIAKIKTLSLDGASGVLDLSDIKYHDNIISLNAFAEDFSQDGYYEALELGEIQLGELDIKDTYLSYNLKNAKINSTYNIRVQDPNTRVFNYFRKILSIALHKTVEFNNAKHPYIEASGEIKDNIVIVEDVHAKHNLLSFDGKGKIDLNENDIKIYIRVKGIEQFVPIESLRLDYIIPSNLIPIEISGTIEKPKANIALTKVITTVEPKLIQKVREGFFSIFSRDKQKQEKIETP